MASKFRVLLVTPRHEFYMGILSERLVWRHASEFLGGQHAPKHQSLDTAPPHSQLDNLDDIAMYRALNRTPMIDREWVGAGPTPKP